MNERPLKKWEWCLVYLGIILSAAVVVWGLYEIVRINIDKFY